MAIDPSRGAAYTDIQSLTALKHEARAQDPGALREATRQFESVFTRMLLQSMRQASSGDTLFDSQQSGFYRDMFDDQLSVELSRGRGLGLAEMMTQQLLRAGAGIRDGGATAAMPTTQAATAGVAAKAAAAQATTVAVAAVGEGSSASRRAAFVREMLPHAEAAGRELGVAPQTLIAHAALETGWGRSMPRGADGQPSFNLFGVKAGASWQGAAVGSRTVEFEAGIAGNRVERFRAYESPAESFGDYVSLLKGASRYAAAIGTGEDAVAFAGALQKGGYATDPDYARKLTSVVAGVRGILEAGLKPGDALPIPPAERTS
jgi:flagellar protein FlgJ